MQKRFPGRPTDHQSPTLLKCGHHISYYKKRDNALENLLRMLISEGKKRFYKGMIVMSCEKNCTILVHLKASNLLKKSVS